MQLLECKHTVHIQVVQITWLVGACCAAGATSSKRGGVSRLPTVQAQCRLVLRPTGGQGSLAALSQHSQSSHSLNGRCSKRQQQQLGAVQQSTAACFGASCLASAVLHHAVRVLVLQTAYKDGSSQLHLTTLALKPPPQPAGNGNFDHIGDKVPLPPVIHLNDGVYEVGRTSPADIRLEVPTVSSRHALLRVGEGAGVARGGGGVERRGACWEGRAQLGRSCV